ncbi:MAG: hypothetical protein IKA30_04825, partial [Alphaproteobacteria bacterium]|nr:hypothetical protein [Alphaproteobacteria bacterium]
KHFNRLLTLTSSKEILSFDDKFHCYYATECIENAKEKARERLNISPFDENACINPVLMT